MRFESYPDVKVDILASGRFTWKKERTIFELFEDFSARCLVENFEASGFQGLGPVLEMQGRVTQSDGQGRISFEFKGGLERGFRVEALHLDSELLCEIFPESNGKSFCKLFRATSETPVLPVLEVKKEASPLVFQKRTISPKIVAPLKSDEFKKALARLNRQLRRHQGKDGAIRLRELAPHQRDFLAHILAAPLAFLEDDAKPLIENLGGAGKKRPRLHFICLELPEEPFGSWRAIVGESTKGGVIVVYELDGFSIVDRTLVA